MKRKGFVISKQNTIATPSPLGRMRVNLALAALFLSTFVAGTAELIVVGILDLIADEMAVAASTAGGLVTAYALGFSIGGPVLTAATIKIARTRLLWASIAAYVLGNAIAVLAVNFGMLLIARVLTGCLHGLLVGVAFAVGTGMLPPEKMGKAISFVFGGVAVSVALGIPLGTLIGQAWGWEASFITIILAGIVALGLALAVVPPVPSSGSGDLGSQAKYAFAPKVLALLGFALVVMGGQFAALTYLQPFLDGVTGVSGNMVSIFLFAYGAANAAGTFLGGPAADRNASATIMIGSFVLVLALATLYFAGENPIIAAAALAAWGIAGFGIVPSIQYRVVSLAGPGGDLASTLPASVINLGIAGGSLLGGAVLASNGARGPVLTAALICAVGVLGAYATSFIKPEIPLDTQPEAA